MSEKCLHRNSFNCIGCRNNMCSFLTDTNFHGKPCPFFKTKKQVIIEKIHIFRHLTEINYFNIDEMSEPEREMYFLTESEMNFCIYNNIDYSGIPVKKEKR